MATNSTKYVWAVHGLVIRSEPHPNATKLGVISYGDSLEILEETNREYTNLFIRNGDNERNPIHLKSKWVRIHSRETKGYVINGYLLDIPVPFLREELNQYLNRMSSMCDTLDLDTVYTLRFGPVVFKSKQLVFSNDKSISWIKEPIIKADDGIESESDYILEDIKYFKGFSKQELLVFLNPFFGIEEGQASPFNGGTYYARRNWKESIFLTDGGMQEIELTVFPNQVIIFYYQASC